jgi:predicted Zn-dependent peptidase
MSIQLTKLPSGLRVITDTVREVDSVAIGVWADVGTRHEDMKHNGVAHMVEHMLFKGTPARNAVQIAEQIEDVGGQVNAYTSREMTAYHVHLLKEDLPLSLEILSDIIQHSTMPEDEVERERDVILQEIGMTADTPDDIVFDNYQEVAYPGQALGAPILGRTEIITGMRRDTLMEYVDRFYTPGKLVVSAAGNVGHDELAKRVADLFGDLPQDKKFKEDGAHYTGGEHRTERALEQSHIVLGFEGVNRHEDDYYTAAALSTVLGGGMSSRLFQEIREKRGLVYSIFSFHSAYEDSGQFAIYAGTGPEKLPELIPVVCDEVKRICEVAATPQELARAKAQMKANLLMGRESMMTRANQQAKQLIHFNGIFDAAERLARIEAITTESVGELARRIFSGAPTLAALGPLSKLEAYDKIKARLA